MVWPWANRARVCPSMATARQPAARTSASWATRTKFALPRCPWTIARVLPNMIRTLWVLTYLCDECPPSVQKKMKRSTRGQATRVQVEQHAQTGLGVGPVNVSGGAGQAHGLGRNCQNWIIARRENRGARLGKRDYIWVSPLPIPTHGADPLWGASQCVR